MASYAAMRRIFPEGGLSPVCARKNRAWSPELRQVRRYFDLQKRLTDNYMILVDIKNDTALLSRNFLQDFGVRGDTMSRIRGEWLALVHPDDRDKVESDLGKLMKATRDEGRDVYYRVKDVHGMYRWLRCRGEVAVDGDGRPVAYAGLLASLSSEGLADPVTGLLNKRPFEAAVKRALTDYRENGKGGAILFVGLDNFKIVNETFNRFFGDKVLQEVANDIKKLLKPGMRLYKLDGDVFAMLYPGASTEDIGELFDSLQRSIGRTRTLDGKEYLCTVSGGTVFYPQAGKDFFVLYKHAEAAMDLAKRDGKNRNCIFTREAYNHWVRLLSNRETIQDSVREGCEGFQLFFQPIVAANTRRMTGAEGLLRWKNPKGRMVAPMEFIPILEQTKLIIPVGRWIVSRALDVCQKWQRVIPDFTVNVNVSYEQLKDPSFKDYVLESLEERSLAPSSINIELTESSIVSDWKFMNDQFIFFREHGIKIAMDDFGTGYSSLAMLKNAACNIIKIDRAFVKQILESSFDRDLVRYMVRLCHSIGQEVCVEGVEDAETLGLLEETGVDYIQGYFFGHPEDVEKFERVYLEEYKHA